jgi:plasmid stabilization system protein ParE
VKRYQVELSPDALAQAAVAAAWWQEHRSGASDLFRVELHAAIERLATMPRSGRAYERSDVPGMHRMIMPRTRYHVYYTILQELSMVRIHAVWHSARGGTPGL